MSRTFARLGTGVPVSFGRFTEVSFHGEAFSEAFSEALVKLLVVLSLLSLLSLWHWDLQMEEQYG